MRPRPTPHSDGSWRGPPAGGDAGIPWATAWARLLTRHYRHPRGMPHAAFVRRMDEISDQTAPAWRALAIGRRILCLVDRYLAGMDVDFDLRRVDSVALRRAVAALSDDAWRAALAPIGDVVACETERHLASLPSLVAAYGHVLEDAAEWRLAIDVYETGLLAALCCEPRGRDDIRVLVRRIAGCVMARDRGEGRSDAASIERALSRRVTEVSRRGGLATPPAAREQPDD